MGNHLTLTSADGFELDAYRADPPADVATLGAVVVIQEIFGVNSHIRSVVDRYSANGYVAIAPALFDRVERGVELTYEAPDVEIGRGIARGGKLDNDQSLLDVRAAAAAVSGAAGGDGKVGVVGFCWGGLLVARSAIESADVFSAGVAYYGGGAPALADQHPTVPMMMHFGEHDTAIPLADVEVLRAAWPHVTFHIYDAHHGFNCDARASYDPAAANLAQERTFAFLAEHLL